MSEKKESNIKDDKLKNVSGGKTSADRRPVKKTDSIGPRRNAPEVEIKDERI